MHGLEGLFCKTGKSLDKRQNRSREKNIGPKHNRLADPIGGKERENEGRGVPSPRWAGSGGWALLDWKRTGTGSTQASEAAVPLFDRKKIEGNAGGFRRCRWLLSLQEEERGSAGT